MPAWQVSLMNLWGDRELINKQHFKRRTTEKIYQKTITHQYIIKNIYKPDVIKTCQV
jgi:hypothetical protein